MIFSTLRAGLTGLLLLGELDHLTFKRPLVHTINVREIRIMTQHETTLQRYGDYRPTQFDPRGLALPDQQDWLVAPVIQTRDSEPLEASNFATFLAALDGESDTVEVHRFGHWANGWFEIILIDPKDTARVERAEELGNALADYPVLDETDLSAREWTEYEASWRNGAAHDMRHALKDKFRLGELSHVYDLLHDADPDQMREYYESLEPSETYGADCWPSIKSAMRNATRENLAAWLRGVRKAIKAERGRH